MRTPALLPALPRALLPPLLGALLGAAGCEEGDPRTSEIWVVDLVTHLDEVEATVAPLGMDRIELEARLRFWLEHYFDGLAIHFDFGRAEESPYRSGICLRAAQDATFAWGVLDEGNAQADHVCGERDGIAYGVYLDRVALTLDQLVVGLGLGPEELADEYARLLAVVVAHEIGHGLGLRHSGPEEDVGDIMRPPFLVLGVEYAFSEADRARIEANLAR